MELRSRQHASLLFLGTRKQLEISWFILWMQDLMGKSSLNVEFFIWWVVYLPLWKIWLRQLGWWNSQCMEKLKTCSKPPTSHCHVWLPEGMLSGFNSPRGMVSCWWFHQGFFKTTYFESTTASPIIGFRFRRNKWTCPMNVMNSLNQKKCTVDQNTFNKTRVLTYFPSNIIFLVL